MMTDHDEPRPRPGPEAQPKPRIQAYPGRVVVHYRGADGAEYVDRWRDVTVVFQLDGWVHVTQDRKEIVAYPPQGIVKLAGA